MKPRLWSAEAITPAVVLLFASLPAAVGCASAPTQSAAMKGHPGVEAPVSEVRMRVRGLAGRFSGLLEETTDRVIATSSDPALHRAMLLTKTNAIPVLQESLFRPDPLEALLDSWALIAQMQDRIAASDVWHGFTAARSLVAETLQQMEAELEEVFRKVAPKMDVAAVRGRVHAWAAEHPVGDSLASRVSTRSFIADTVKQDSVGSLQALAALPETLDDAMTRVDTYVRFTPKQARWQAELLVDDLVTGPDGRTPFDQLAEVSASVDRISKVVEQLPGLSAREREAVLHAVTAERTASLEAIRRERLETLAFVNEQRELITKDLAVGRQALIDDLRIKVVADVETMRGHLVADAADRLQRIADRSIALAAVVLAAFGLGMFVAGFVLIRFVGRPPGSVAS
ncbi:MAG TPA: hypothetical protein VMS64_10855 [Candidatus Methylomirabilis sp.]|nr:hypothetical protein [Candidatus Methylomirabilis sp.]